MTEQERILRARIADLYKRFDEAIATHRRTVVQADAIAVEIRTITDQIKQLGARSNSLLDRHTELMKVAEGLPLEAITDAIDKAQKELIELLDAQLKPS